MKNLVIAGMVLVLGPMLYFSAAHAQDTKTMRIGLATAATHIQNTGSEAFKKFIEEKTNGAIKVEIYPGAQLGDNKAMLDSVKIGAVDGIFPSPADLGNIDKNFNIMNFPFLFSSQETANRVTDGQWGDKLLARLDNYGYKGLAIVDSGFRQTTNSKHAIKSLDDFKGLKIRMQPNPLHLDIFRALGANPAPLSFAELFSALQQGVMDGQENPLNNIYASKLHEVQKFVTLDGHIYDTNIFLVGKTFYEGLTPEQQQLFQEGADVIVQTMRQALKERDAAALEGMKAAGLEITEVSPEFHDALVQATRPVVEKYLPTVDAALYAELLEAATN
ncbi:TRAP transporter substrate-binding protein [Mesorhizobium sp. KR9-304]|uniref:TRAP transporter substrate-binding protein n=1 Tax=Mesorhizobium sp. KR9-304 TaxID=3156614 RepID=UPI0032B32280